MKYDVEQESLYLYILSQCKNIAGRQFSISELDGLRIKYGNFQLALQSVQSGGQQKRSQHPMYSATELSHKLSSEQIQVLPYYSPDYPKLLKNTHSTPAVLFYRGNVSLLDQNCVAIVGSRKMASYGYSIMAQITQPLINAGVVIVSGLAYGADSEAHSQAIKNSGQTIAVLGSSINNASVYPRGHLRLAHNIIESGGLLLSEYPPDTPALKHHFLARNRIIAGISLGTVVMECKRQSGALITSQYALDFNRNVYAVPGPINSSLSAGPHYLIQEGAMLITSGHDIVQDLHLSTIEDGLKSSSSTTNKNYQHCNSLSKSEITVLKYLQDQPATIDWLSTQTTMPIQELINTITQLELKGVIKDVGAQSFAVI